MGPGQLTCQDWGLRGTAAGDEPRGRQSSPRRSNISISENLLAPPFPLANRVFDVVPPPVTFPFLLIMIGFAIMVALFPGIVTFLPDLLLG